MTGPQYPGQPEGQQPPQYGNPDLNKGPEQGSYPPPPPAGQYPPPGQYQQPGAYPPPPPVGQAPYEQGIYQTSGQPAGAGIRLGARIIDGLIVGVSTNILAFIIGAVAGTVAAYIAGVVLSFVAIAYFTYLESNRGATFGKQLLKLRAVGPDGNNPSQQVAFKRNIWLLLNVLSSLLGFFILLSGLVGLASLALVIAIGVTISNDPNKQGLHDKFAGGTRVIKV